MAESQFDKLKYLGRFKLFVVILFFAAPVAFTVAELGFQTDNSSVYAARHSLFSSEMLLAVNAVCGMFGGLVMARKRRIIYIISGAVTTLASTAFSIIYFDWRTSIISLEFIIPLGVGIFAGVLTFNLLSKLIPEKEAKSYTTPE